MDQGDQQRKFKYDSIGRLLFERIPEQSATINDGTGAYWSCKYTYTTFNAVATRQDARGVVTTYDYDDLNRLESIGYNTVSGVTTAPTVTYIYDYDSTYGTTADGMVVRVKSILSINPMTRLRLARERRVRRPVMSVQEELKLEFRSVPAVACGVGTAAAGDATNPEAACEFTAAAREDVSYLRSKPAKEKRRESVHCAVGGRFFGAQ